ncbi:MAG TPA: bifunctional UDP-N-acetylmuramoyl-tripeptide:D-alanyl-D-alanine ligase/alanine racemase, partial [Flavobacteriales bacterium]|nr:bifunctional UDP-N-acetylmuramoyl-tripeptide:D-alanyl-D-alanine ligase/alanine racemase [Flavobacteriales bacterium]
MRMEMKRGIENSVLIDDSYNSDLGSLQAALDQLAVQKADGQLVILTDMYQNLASDHLYKEISEQLNASKIDHLVLIGPEIGKFQGLFKQNRIDHFEDVEAYLSVINPVDFRNKAVLVKGARAFRLEKLVHRLQAQQHETVLEVDLHKLGKNLEYFRGKIKNETLIMVMVKAFSYGSGGYEIANFLQTQNIDYLSVAYADEGVALRKRGIRLPI